MTMNRPYQIASIVIILFSAYWGRESLNLQYMTPLGPGPGFFPLWLSVMTVALAAVMFYQATFKRSGPMPDDFFASKMGYLRIAGMILAILACVLFMEVIGFRLMMLVFYIFLLSILGRQKPLMTLIVALAGSWGVYHVFVELLKVPLPIGIFDI